MKFCLSAFVILFSIFAQAQLTLNPAPVSNNISITSSQNYIYITNTGSVASSPVLTIDSNAANISIGSNRCSVIQPNPNVLHHCFFSKLWSFK